MPIPIEIIEQLATVNLKTEGSMGAHSSGLAMQDAVANQRLANSNATFYQGLAFKTANTFSDALQAIMCGHVAEALNKATSLDVVESVASRGLDTADLPRHLAQLGTQFTNLEQMIAGVNALVQQIAKIAQTTPPPTGGSGGSS
jgi:hypothetical protein